MKKIYVIDTNTLIFFFSYIFQQPNRLSPSTFQLLQQAFSGSSEILLSIPSIVFLEIFDKWLLTEEFAAKFYYQVYEPILRNENIEIRSIDIEVIQNLVRLDGSLIGHDMHDKIILASAMVLGCPLITTDAVIINYVQESKVIPDTIN